MPHPRQPVGRRVRRPADGGRRAARRTSRRWAGSSWPACSHGARQLTWLWAPYVNSYKRYVPGSWAPTAAVWGVDNRTCGFRLVGHGEGRRVECRIPGADVNPYLALAGIIAAGLWGVEHDLELPAALRGQRLQRHRRPARARRPWSRPSTSSSRRRSPRDAFGDDVHHHLLNTARQEWVRANQVVTDWELARNFERI